MKTIIEIPIKPLTENQIWQGTRTKTETYRDWRKEAFYMIKKERCRKVSGWVSVETHFYIKNFSISDVTNFLKGLMDALVDAGAIDDDRFVKWERSEKWPVKNKEDERIEVIITPIEVNPKDYK